MDAIGLGGSIVDDKDQDESSFILKASNFRFEMDREKFFVVDYLGLEYADKCEPFVSRVFGYWNLIKISIYKYLV